jgi:hypothetical protein
MPITVANRWNTGLSGVAGVEAECSQDGAADMWLPKDERLILAGLYHNIPDRRDAAYQVVDLIKLLGGYRKINLPETHEAESGRDDSVATKESIKEYINDDRRVQQALRQLEARGLIALTQHEHDQSIFVVALTLPGYDLGRRYANWFDRTGLCFQEYRHHWLWLFVAFVGGGIVAKLIDWLFD